MLKKTLAAVGIAGALLVGSATAAFADEYPTNVPVIAASPTVAPGGSTLITATGLGDYTEVTFTVTSGPAGASLASIALTAAAPGSSVVKPVVNAQASATLTTTTAGTYRVAVFGNGSEIGSTTVTAVAPGTPATGGTALPPTGGSVPAAAIWAGVGAVGLGGIAVAAVAARRRTQKI